MSIFNRLFKKSVTSIQTCGIIRTTNSKEKLPMLKLCYQFETKKENHQESLQALKGAGLRINNISKLSSLNQEVITTSAVYAKIPVMVELCKDKVTISLTNQKPISASKVDKLISIFGEVTLSALEDSKPHASFKKTKLSADDNDKIHKLNVKFEKLLTANRKIKSQTRKQKCVYKTKEKNRRNKARAKTGRM
jgi:hypothetical protein